jgi:putative transposase
VTNERRTVRLQNYDYSQAGAYFVTLCTHGREHLFGEIADGVMQLDELGKIVTVEWERSAEIRKEIELDAFVVMPNHVHGIIMIVNESVSAEATGIENTTVGATGRAPLRGHQRPHGPAKRSLGSFVAGFKSSVTKRINELRLMPGGTVWQRNYYEHVIRNDADLQRTRDYIVQNPVRWPEDDYNVNRVKNARTSQTSLPRR